jgi:hypothetical protein
VNTGENEHALRKIIDLTRLISIAVLILHYYFFCYTAFKNLGLSSPISDRLLYNIAATGLFNNFYKSKILALAFLAISLLGVRGKKDQNISFKKVLGFTCSGTFLFFISFICFYSSTNMLMKSVLYVSVMSTGYLLILTGGTLLSRMITQQLSQKDIFNKQNETFPQEERLLKNNYSINLPATYQLKNKRKQSWINIINPFRGVLVIGSPGSGKSYFIIQHIIKQHLDKGFSMFVYDYKFDDLSVIAYNHYLNNRHCYISHPAFYLINFDNLSKSHRCNPLAPSTMFDITDAAESSRTIMMGLNREWIKRQGDFFVESPINFLTAIIWFLKKYHDGMFCTLPHVIELMQVSYEKLFTVLRTEPEVEV